MKDFDETFVPIKSDEFPSEKGQQLNIEESQELEIPSFVDADVVADVVADLTDDFVEVLPKKVKKKFSFKDLKLAENPFFWLCFTIITTYSVVFIDKFNLFSNVETVVFFGFCGIIGLIVPIFLSKQNLTFATCKKDAVKFLLFFSIGASLVVESVTFYIAGDDFFAIVTKSNFNVLDISTFLGVLVSFLYISCVFIYFNIIYSMLEKKYSPIYNILICTIAMSMVFSQNFFKNIVICFLIFYLRKVFSSVYASMIFTIIWFVINSWFELIFIKYFMFNIMQYFVFGFIVLAFFMLDKSINFFEKNEFYGLHSYPKIELPTKADLKIIYFSILFIAIYLLSFLEV